MKIAVCAVENNENSEISERAARAPFFLIFENEKIIDAIKNPFSFGGGGAGFAAAKLLADKKVKIVVAGKAGLNFASALSEKGIELKEKKGKAKDAV
jgi:predicted Fe-Mo cluster-binding NifX family protein